MKFDKFNEENQIKQIKGKLEPLNSLLSPPASLLPKNITAFVKNNTKITPNPESVPTPLKKAVWKRSFASVLAACLVLAVFVSAFWLVNTERFPFSGANRTVETSSQIDLQTVTPGDLPVLAVEPSADLHAEGYGDIYRTLDRIRANGWTGAIYAAFTDDSTMEDAAGRDNGTLYGSGTKSADLTPKTVTGAGGEDNTDHGATNTQTEGVDEADIIKNDGEYIYLLTQPGIYSANPVETPGWQLSVIKTGASGKMSLISRITLAAADFKSGDGSFIPSDMYICGDFLAVVGQKKSIRNAEQENQNGNSAGSKTAAAFRWGYYGYDSEVDIYDISDKAAPKKLRSFCQNGELVSSRAIGNKLYLVTNFTLGDLSGLTEDNIANFVPRYSNGDKIDEPVAFERISVVPECGTPVYAVATVLDVTNGDAPPATESVLGSGQTVYASLENLYLAGSRYQQILQTETTASTSAATVVGSSSYTDILRFSLADGGIKYSGIASVEGTVINQFALDEWGGNLRLAVTAANPHNFNATETRLYILGGDMRKLGEINNLAPGEQIQSVRFTGEKGYVVTFLQKDPLFTFDLSDPANPKVTGQLKIPGFSSYMHPLSSGYMLGIGPDGDDSGRIYGLKLSLFDVTDPFDPKEKFKFSIGDSNTYTTGLYDHREITYDTKTGILALPTEIYTYSGYFTDDIFNSTLSFYGVYLFKIDLQTGITPICRLTCALPRTENTAKLAVPGYGLIDRSTFIGDCWFAFSSAHAISVNVKTLTRVDSIVLDKTYFESAGAKAYKGFTEKNGVVPLFTPDAADIPYTD